jgi:hypothetical protein
MAPREREAKSYLLTDGTATAGRPHPYVLIGTSITHVTGTVSALARDRSAVS